MSPQLKDDKYKSFSSTDANQAKTAPWGLGLLWTTQNGYSIGLRWLLVAGILGVLALWLVQARSLTNKRRSL